MERLDALTALYRDYLEGYAQRQEEAGPLRGLHKFIRGGPSRSDSKADLAFYHAVEQAVAAWTEEDDALQAVRLMLLEAEGTDAGSRLMMDAAQALAIPLLPRLRREEAGEILAAYKARYPKKRMLLPKQRELLAALEQAAK